ncbi:30S ribosomal protein S5 [uncultured archaeon]|nr:30S ribosomal protein S5 [uncultured archaeon]
MNSETDPWATGEGAGEEPVIWKPRTKLGLQVRTGQITSIHDVIRSQQPIKEVEIVDKLLPTTSEEILDVGRVQRVTDSGRRLKFRIVTAIGNGDGYVGVGTSKGKEAGPTIRSSIERAKLALIEVKRGCGSWECMCGGHHSVPFTVEGKAGSVTVILKPAPKGTGIVSGEIARKIIALSGIKDVYVQTSGHTRTSINFAFAVYDALKNTNNPKTLSDQEKKLGVVVGEVKPVVPTE